MGSGMASATVKISHKVLPPPQQETYLLAPVYGQFVVQRRHDGPVLPGIYPVADQWIFRNGRVSPVGYEYQFDYLERREGTV